MEYTKLTDGIEIKEVLQGKKSNTTESYYILFKDENGDVYQLALSDHYADNHWIPFTDDEYDLSDELTDIINDDDLVDCITSLEYYGFSKAKKYDEKEVNELIDKGNLDKALSGETYDLKIETTELTENDQVLIINDSDLMINYLPKTEDINLVNELVENEVTTKDFYQQNENFLTAQNNFLEGK